MDIQISKSIIERVCREINDFWTTEEYKVALYRLLDLSGDHLFIPETLQKLYIISNQYESFTPATIEQVARFCIRFRRFIRSFKSTSNEEKVNSRDEIFDAYTKLYNQFEAIWERISVILNLVQKDRDIGLEIDSERKKMLEEINELRSAKNNLEEIIEEQKNRYAPVFANQEFELQRNLFSMVADKYRWSSYLWLMGILISTGLFVYLIFYIKNNFCFDTTCVDVLDLQRYNSICPSCGHELLWFEMVKSLLFRLLIISLSIYLINFCVRNYNATMHNRVTNQLRQNIFNSALHFYNTTTGSGKEEMLIKAAESLFTHRNTGYNNKSSEADTNNLFRKIIEKLPAK